MVIDLSRYTSRLQSWDDLTMHDMVHAYRKAKYDCFWERAVSHCREFARFEQDLEGGLQRILRQLQSPRRSVIAKRYLGELFIVPKGLSVDPIAPADDGSRSNGRAYFADKDRAFAYLLQSQRHCAEFRITGKFPVEAHLLSALWINRIGHRFDACLGKAAYGNRLRRRRQSAAVEERTYDLRGLGSTKAYFYDYKRWRDDGMRVIRRELEAHEKVVALTLDVRNYFHRMDPSFIANPEFHEALGLTGDNESPKARLTEVEREFTGLLLEFLLNWSRTAAATIAEASRESVISPTQGIPISLSASRILANVLLHTWDQAIEEELRPIHYGRYVDDMFLVLRDAGKVPPGGLMEWVASKLPAGMLVRAESDGIDGHRIFPGGFAKGSEIVLQGKKQKVFFLSGRAGLDLLETIKKHVDALSSERRMMPDPDFLTRSQAARVLCTSTDGTAHVDTLRKSDGLSVKRMAFAIQLGGAETVERDLPASEWKKERYALFEFAVEHIVRPESILTYVDYLGRLLGLAVACGDWGKAGELVDAAIRSLGALLSPPIAKLSYRFNGHAVDGLNTELERMVRESFTGRLKDATLRAWPWERSKGATRPCLGGKSARKFREKVGIEREVIDDDAARMIEADLARQPLRQHRRLWGFGPTAFGSSGSLFEDVFEGQIDEIRDFLRVSGPRRVRGWKRSEMADNEPLTPYLLPTRPFDPREIAELDPECIDLGKEAIGRARARRRWQRRVEAFRGVAPMPDTQDAILSEQSNVPDSKPRIVTIGRSRNGSAPRLALASLRTDVACWNQAARGAPVRSKRRYRQVLRLVNNVIRSEPAATHLLLPELSLPNAWIESVADRLMRSRISLIAGAEYRGLKKPRLLNEAVLVLTDDRLGYPASVMIRQRKVAPAPGEEEELLRVHGKQYPEKARKPDLGGIVYRHGGFDFAVMICSELQDIERRSRFRGEVDSLIVLSWCKDIETFAPLIESAALDVHAYIAFVNNREYGDSRVRSPAKKSHQRDLCRIRGGEDNYAVVVKLDVEELRRFQSRAKNWPRDDDPFKPVPQSFKIAKRRELTPGGSSDQPAVEPSADDLTELAGGNDDESWS